MKSKYKYSGKSYNGEKAIISLTSWKARINTVSKTIYSLLKQCPGFHIVLVLSEEEFPRMEQELPADLLLFVKHRMIELLWVYKNYKSFKKVLFTMDKYRNVPVISADDDCVYSYNYAEELYQEWIQNKSKIISLSYTFGSGYGILFTPHCFRQFGIKNLSEQILKTNHDDMYYFISLKKLNIKIKSLHSIKELENAVYFHDENESITSSNTAINDVNRELFTKLIQVN